ncbi:MAG: translation initiation factor IF-3 [Phycisphaerales bacterium]|nr:translation initiation factor IF-3 [Phycisphaerales bacterium]
MQGPVQRTRINHMIRLSPIRLIDQDGEQVGVIETHEAMRMAQEAGLDLVEISPEARPPVCKIMDYGKYKYEQSKREQKSRTHGGELKEIRLGRSIKIDPHDVQIRVGQARRFLIAGHKVQITQRFRGREMAHRELGEERLFQICQDLSDVAKIEMAPRGVGRAITLVLAPDKAKIEQYKARLAKEGQEEDDDLEKLEAEVAAQNAAIGDDDDDGDDDAQDKGKSKKQRGPRDDRAGNPVDDEVADLLGEL